MEGGARGAAREDPGGGQRGVRAAGLRPPRRLDHDQGRVYPRRDHGRGGGAPVF